MNLLKRKKQENKVNKAKEFENAFVDDEDDDDEEDDEENEDLEETPKRLPKLPPVRQEKEETVVPQIRFVFANPELQLLNDKLDYIIQTLNDSLKE